MMDTIYSFVSENLALVIILGVIAVIVGDEVLGISRGLLGDETENLPATPQARAKAEEEWVDPLEETPSEGEAKLDDFLTPPPRRKR